MLGITETLDRHLRIAGWLPAREGISPGASQRDAMSGRYNPAAKWWTRCRTVYPRLVRQRFGDGPTRWRTLSVWDDIALSTSGAYYGRTDMPLAIDLPGPRDLPRCYFIGGGREDPYGKKKFPTGSAGHQKALHLEYDWLAVQRGEDALALVSYPMRVLDDPLVTNLQSHFVFRTPQAVLVDGRAIEVPDQPVWRRQLPAGAKLALKYGSAAVGIRVPWSRDQQGRTAALTLARDSSQWGVMRVTVEHRPDDELLPAEQTAREPAALLWVRVAHGLTSKDAFAEWDRGFRAAEAKLDISNDLAEFMVFGTAGPLSLRVQQPWTPLRYAVTTPAPPAGILEVNGVEIGRPLLETLKPLRAIAEMEANYRPEQIPESGQHFWEAEDAIVLPNFVGQDAAASGGRYVTVNDAVTWQLRIPVRGTYYLWARIKADDPQHDSRYVQWTPGAAGRPRLDWHLTRGSKWHWDCVRLSKSTEPAKIELPEGVSELTFSIREPDSRFDRLFITRDPTVTPPESE